MTKITITTNAMRNIIPAFLVRRIIVSTIPTTNSVVTSPREVIMIIAMSRLELLPCTDLKNLLAASSIGKVIPEATMALKMMNAAKRITKCRDRVLIIQGARSASVADNQTE